MDTTNKKGFGVGVAETSPVTYEAGLYRHPETGAEIVTLYDPLLGNAQSEGVSRLGFVRVGDTPTGYIKSIVEINIEKNAENAANDDKARLDKLELAESKRRIAELEAQLAAPQVAEVPPEVVEEVGETTKTATTKSSKK